jgi:hypothetical protein
MAYANGGGSISPATSDGMNIRATNTTALDLDIDVVVAKLLWLEL